VVQIDYTTRNKRTLYKEREFTAVVTLIFVYIHKKEILKSFSSYTKQFLR